MTAAEILSASETKLERARELRLQAAERLTRIKALNDEAKALNDEVVVLLAESQTAGAEAEALMHKARGGLQQ